MPSGSYVRLVEIDLALPESPEGPHILVNYGTIGIGTVDVWKACLAWPSASGVQAPRAQMTASQSMSALVGGDGLNAAGPGVVAHDLDARADLDAVLLTLLHQTTENVFGPDVAAEPFVQGNVNALGLEVGPDGLEEVLWPPCRRRGWRCSQPTGGTCASSRSRRVWLASPQETYPTCWKPKLIGSIIHTSTLCLSMG